MVKRHFASVLTTISDVSRTKRDLPQCLLFIIIRPCRGRHFLAICLHEPVTESLHRKLANQRRQTVEFKLFHSFGYYIDERVQFGQNVLLFLR